MYKKFYIDTLKVRARVLDQAYKNGEWNGTNASQYARRKKTKDQMNTILNSIISTPIQKITYQQSGKESYIYINHNEDHYSVLNEIYNKGLTGHYIGLTS